MKTTWRGAWHKARARPAVLPLTSLSFREAGSARVPVLGVGAGGRRLMLSRHEPAEFTGVEKREYSQPVSDIGSPVWEAAKSPPLGVQGVLVKLFPLLTEFGLRDRCRCCAQSTHHSPCGEVCANDREEPQLLPRGQWLSCGS